MPTEISKKFIIIFLFTIFALSFFRIFYGVEITDEALCIGDAYLVSNGLIPISYSWTQFSTHFLNSSVILKPFLYLTKNNTEGIFLYMRSSFFILKLTVYYLLYFVLKQYFDKYNVILIGSIVCILDYFNLINWQYTNTSVYLNIISTLLLSYGIDKTKNKYIFLSGVINGLSILSYPSQIISFVLSCVIGFIIYKNKKSDNVLCALKYYAMGCILVGIISIGFIILNSSIFDFINGIKNIFTVNPYFGIQNRSKFVIISNDALYILKILKIWFLIILTFIFLKWLTYLRKINIKALRNIYIPYYAYFVFLAILIIKGEYVDHQRFIVSIIFPHVFLTMFYIKCIVEKNEKVYKLVLIISTMSFLWILAVGLSTFDGFKQRSLGLIMFYILSMLFYFKAIDVDKFLLDIWKIIIKFSSVLIVIVISILNLYGYFYREDSFSKLNTEVKEGIYKGLYTSRYRATKVIELEKNIRKLTNANEFILFMDNVPMAYLMTTAKHCTPSSWDFSCYSYGLNDDSWYMTYFKTLNKSPDKIIYIKTNRDKIVSNDFNEYHFNNFVNQYYKQIYGPTRLENFFDIKVFAKKDDTK